MSQFWLKGNIVWAMYCWNATMDFRNFWSWKTYWGNWVCNRPLFSNSYSYYKEILFRRLFKLSILLFFLLGTEIWRDEWKAYKCLSNEGFLHRTVNHSRNFKDPVSGVHTNLIESFWTQCKRKLKSMSGTWASFCSSHVDVFFGVSTTARRRLKLLKIFLVK